MALEINILLLGETGAGKTTFLNSLANYLHFKNFDEANKAVKIVEIAPSQFTLPDPLSNGKPKTIKSKTFDVYERLGGGNSATLAPTVYTFSCEKNLFRIIDTPGMGDTKGIEIDKYNFEQILLSLDMYRYLHGVIIISNGQNNRHTAFFKYCITELFTYLHKSISKNIVFCFSNSKIASGMYGAKEGYDVMDSFLKELEITNTVKLEKNVFYIENDTFRYLLSKNNGYIYNERQAFGYCENWDYSVEQIKQMFSHILSIEPHDLYHTISLNHARKTVLEFSEPIVLLTQNIANNINEISNLETSLDVYTGTKDDLTKILNTTIIDVEKEPNDDPKLICTSKSCTEIIKVDDEEKINYKTVCHKNCLCFYGNKITGNLSNVPTFFCDSMNYTYLQVIYSLYNKDYSFISKVKCKFCNCSWTEHKPITCRYVKVTRKIINKEIENKIKTTTDVIKQKNILINSVQKSLNEFKEEKAKIEKIASIFGHFINKNSFLAHNRFFENYIETIINQENHKNSPKVEELLEMKLKYQQNLFFLTEAISNNSHPEITFETILELKKELLELKHNGSSFKKFLQAENNLKTNFKKREKSVFTISKIKNDLSEGIYKFFYQNKNTNI